MSCVGITNKLHRCKNSATCKIECYGFPLSVCHQHKGINPIYLWSYNVDNPEIPFNIKEYLDFYNDITFYHRDLNKWLSVMVTTELHKRESSKLSKRRLLGKFYDAILTPVTGDDLECPVCMSGNEFVQTRCGHVFCTGCIQSWSHKKPTCPLCRNLISVYPK